MTDGGADEKPKRRKGGVPTKAAVEGTVGDAIAAVARGRSRRGRATGAVSEAVRQTEAREGVVLNPALAADAVGLEAAAGSPPTPSPSDAVAAVPATTVPVHREPDEPDDMMATALQTMAGVERCEIDFVNQQVRARFPDGHRIVMSVALNGMTRVELFEGMMFFGAENVRTMDRLEAVVAKLRTTWSFAEPL